MERLKKIVGRINESGSCFFINKKHILTASHCLEGKSIGENVEVHFENFPEITKCKILVKLEKPQDFAILESEDFIEANFFPLVSDVVIDGSEVYSFGYPEEYRLQGRAIYEKVIQSNLKLPKRDERKNNFDLKISSQEIRDKSDKMVCGLSGSPIVMEGKIIGIIKSVLGDGIGAQKISNFLEILKKYNIECETMSTFREKIINKSMEEVNKNKETKKYIPGVHIEINSIKDKIRYFCDPLLFYSQLIKRLERLDNTYSNKILERLGLPPIEFNITFYKVTSLEEVTEKVDILKIELKNKIDYMNKLKSRDILSIFPQIDKEEYKLHVGSLMNGYLGNDNEVKKILEDLDYLKSNTLFLLDTAGRGKTTLLCDFVENSLKNKEQLTFFIAVLKIIDGNFQDTFKREVLDLFNMPLKDFLEKINKIAGKDNRPALIIIDGLNESESYKELSITLESFIYMLKQYPNIKLIMSSRTEYFKERFSNLNLLSKSKGVSSIRNVFNFNSNNPLKEKAISKYFKFFNIKGKVINRDVIEEFSNNPLLLRFFCEAYEDKEIFEVHNLYKYNLFLEYTKNKSKILLEKGYDKKLFAKGLENVCNYMITNNTYTKIPLESFGNKALIKEIIHEDVIFREDIIIGQGAFGDETDEVITFTFDEYRDYHLACYLFKTKGKDIKELFSAIDQINSESLPIKEGVARYIYFILKVNKREDILEKIEGLEWTIEPFLEYVFSKDEDEITDNDIKLLFSIFNEPLYSKKIFEHLLTTRNSNKKILNIDLVFDFIKSMDAKSYVENILSMYQEKQNGYFSHNYNDSDSPIFELTKFIEKKLLPENIELSYKLMLVLALTPERYDPSDEALDLLEKLHTQLKGRAKKIIDELRLGCKNDFLKMILNTMEDEGKIGHIRNYRSNLRKILSSTTSKDIEEVLSEMTKKEDNRLADSFLDALLNGSLEITEWEDE